MRIDFEEFPFVNLPMYNPEGMKEISRSNFPSITSFEICCDRISFPSNEYNAKELFS